MLSSTTRMGYAPVVQAIVLALGEYHDPRPSLYTPARPLAPPPTGTKLSGPDFDRKITGMLKPPLGATPRYILDPPYPYPGFDAEQVFPPKKAKKKADPPKAKTAVEKACDKVVDDLIWRGTGVAQPAVGGWFLTRVEVSNKGLIEHIRWWDGKCWSMGMRVNLSERASSPSYYKNKNVSFDQNRIFWARPATLSEIDGR